MLMARLDAQIRTCCTSITTMEAAHKREKRSATSLFITGCSKTKKGNTKRSVRTATGKSDASIVNTSFLRTHRKHVQKSVEVELDGNIRRQLGKE